MFIPSQLRRKECTVNNNTTTHGTKLLRLPQVLQLFPVSKSSWYQGIAEGRYPKPIKLGVRSSAWKASEIQTLIDTLGGDANA